MAQLLRILWTMELTLNTAIMNSLPKDLAAQLVVISINKELPQDIQGTLQRLVISSQLSEEIALLKLPDGRLLPAKIEPMLDVGARLVALLKSPTDIQIRQLIQPTSLQQTNGFFSKSINNSSPLLASTQNTQTVKMGAMTFPPNQPLSIPFTVEGKAPQLPLNQTFNATIETPFKDTQTPQQLMFSPPKMEEVKVSTSQPLPLPVKTVLTVSIPDKNVPAQAIKIKLPIVIQNTPLDTNNVAASGNNERLPAIPLPQQAQVSIILGNSGKTFHSLPSNIPSNIVARESFTLALSADKAITLPIPLAPPEGQKEPLAVQYRIPLPRGNTTVVSLPHLVPENTEMNIRISSDGLAQVVSISTQQERGEGKQAGNSAVPTTTTAQNKTSHQPALVLVPGNTFKGMVTAQAPQNQMIITLDSGHSIQIKAENTLPTGTQLNITIGENGMAEITNLSLPVGSERANAAYNLGKTWPMLKQALNSLKQNKPELARHAENQLPRPEALLPSLLKYINAISSQSAEKFLGDETVQFLRSMGIDLTPDIQSLNNLQQRPEAADSWRSLLFPYIENEGEQPKQGGFFWRRQKDEEKENSAGSLRFILQFNLSKFGNMQLDGLMNTKSQINMRLRINKTPGEVFEKEIKEIVHNSLKAYGMDGGILIDVVENLPVNPLVDIQQHAGHMNMKA